ncbi:cysteine desulfurase SufS [Sodalis sp. CWE]|uniref:cysteine desulfurase SufS n=1 Tax=Sodalis sp. CWE TaxID=2803816 RepID=UPI001C7DF3E0|nr:cysteine desulfurase SufS [Sodalis sp. CWE]
MTYPIIQIRSDFPILTQQINKKPLIYLDNASSTQKPNVVINRERDFYRKEYATVHRGVHTLSNTATAHMENVRQKVANFIHATSSKEIVFTKGATESINLVANSWGRHYLKSGDNVIISQMEHHANIVPWQILAKEKKLNLRFLPLLPDGTLNISLLPTLIDERTRLFAVTQASNVLGTVNPLLELIDQIRKSCNAMVLVDGAQAITHKKVDVQALDCDFYVFSGHKIYGPTGIGILYAKEAILESMPPWEGGGSMIRIVSFTEETTFNEVPWRFEAGTPHIAGIMGLGSAITYIEKTGLENIQIYEKQITEYMLEMLQQIPNMVIYGPCNSDNRIGIVAFNLGKHHAYDVGSFLDQSGIAIRTGHHCAMPLITYFQVTNMCRASIAMYSDHNDIDQLAIGLNRVQQLLG